MTAEQAVSLRWQADESAGARGSAGAVSNLAESNERVTEQHLSPGEYSQHNVTGPESLTLPGIGRIAIVPGSGELVAHGAAVHDAHVALRQLLQACDVADLATARQACERQRVLADQLAAVGQRQRDLAPEGREPLEQERERASALLAAVAGDSQPAMQALRVRASYQPIFQQLKLLWSQQSSIEKPSPKPFAVRAMCWQRLNAIMPRRARRARGAPHRDRTSPGSRCAPGAFGSDAIGCRYSRQCRCCRATG